MSRCQHASEPSRDLLILTVLTPTLQGNPLIKNNSPERYCVIGAGPAGLAACKNLQELAIPYDCFEREADIGGNWLFGSRHSSVNSATNMISSKRLTEFRGYRMPAEYPQYPSHRQALEYLRDYADAFGLYEHIRTNQSVSKVEPVGESWRVTTADDVQRSYRGVLIANGHHWHPRWPAVPGEFSGQLIHAHDYKTPEILSGRRVLVIGAGNSGCDIAVEAAKYARHCCLSMRRGYHFLPKYLCGAPIDRCGENMHRWKVPLWLYRKIADVLTYIAVGPLRRYGLPEPDHRLFESHPIINSQIFHFLAHEQMEVKPDVKSFSGSSVAFADGSQAEFDLIVCATGYNVHLPFCDRRIINWNNGKPELYLNVFHPRYDNLFVVGLIQPDGGIWQLADLQSQLIGWFVLAQTQAPALADWFRREKASNASLRTSIRYVDSPRHAIQVEYFRYRDILIKNIETFARRLRTAT